MKPYNTQHVSRVLIGSISSNPIARGTFVGRVGILAASLVALFVAGCDPNSGGGSGGDGGGGGGSGGGGGGGAVCGGLAGEACPDTDYCNFPDDAMCGAADQTGVCEPKPEGCNEDCPGVCGCDGQFYCNACEAARMGVDVDPNGSCELAEPCGGLAGVQCADAQFCDYPDVPGACGANDQQGECKPRPQACTEDCPGVCGCDGQFYCNECMAQAAGVDVNPEIDCAMTP
jgi:hypothetical protein